MKIISLQMSRWIDNPLATNLAVLLYKSIVSFCLLPNIIEFHYLFYSSCGDLLVIKLIIVYQYKILRG